MGIFPVTEDRFPDGTLTDPTTSFPQAMAATGRVNVFARVRPGVAREDGDQHCVDMNADTGKCLVRLQDGDAVERVLAGGSAAIRTVEKEYTFDGVFDQESTQKEVYEDVGKPVLKDVLQGYNGSILAYGQTGAGKTHSLLNSGMGIDGKPDPKQAGLLPRLVAALFVHVGADVKNVYTVEASMLQIYNEQVDCLLGDDREKAQGLAVTGKSEVKGLAWTKCGTPNDLLQCFQKGRMNLVYAETKMNKSSSRSHAVFQIKVSKRPRALDKTGTKGGKVEMKATFGKLTVVDLAGSERIKKSGVTGAQLKEATNINSSLLSFGNIVQALAEKKKFIPYRDSKLTRILEDSVGGNCKTSLLVCASPSAESSDETVSTLEFASRAARIEITATINEGVVTVDAASLVADMKGEGLDTALKQKHSEMMAMENKLKADAQKETSQLKKAKEDAVKAQQAEKAKATEAGKLMEKWRVKAEEAGKKISSLEEAVKEAAEAKEAKEAVAKAEKQVADLKAQLAKERAERAREADAVAQDLRTQVEATQKLLEEANAKTETLEGRVSEADALCAALNKQLEESSAALDAAQEEAVAALAKAHQDNAEALAQAVEDKEDALRAAEAEACERAEQAAEFSRCEAEAAAEVAREALEADWSMRLDQAKHEGSTELSVAVAAAAEELEAAKAEAATRLDAARSAAEKELSSVRSALEADLATRAGTIAALESTATERAARISALQKEAEELNAQIESTRADLLATRENAAAEAARLDAAHATALAAVEARRREAMEAAEKRQQDQQESHEAEVEALETRATLKGKRLSWAFSASRALLDETNAELKRDWEDMKRRFDARESRADDVANIKGLKQEVGVLAQTCANLKIEKTHLALELENRDVTDAVFGNTGGKRHHAGPKNPASAARNALGQVATPSPNQARRTATISSRNRELAAARRAKTPASVHRPTPPSSKAPVTFHSRDTLGGTLRFSRDFRGSSEKLPAIDGALNAGGLRFSRLNQLPAGNPQSRSQTGVGFL